MAQRRGERKVLYGLCVVARESLAAFELGRQKIGGVHRIGGRAALRNFHQARLADFEPARGLSGLRREGKAWLFQKRADFERRESDA